MHTGNAECYITPSLALWVKPSLIVILFVCFLSSHSLDCISCSYEEMCDAPIGTTSWSPAKRWNGSKKLTYSGSRGGIVLYIYIYIYTYMKSSSRELHTPAADSENVKIYAKINSLSLMGKISNWRKISRVSISVWSFSRVWPH